MFNIQNRRYLGNKFHLIDFIHTTIEQECGSINSIFDIFAGTGVVAWSYMSRAKIYVNDILYSNHLIHYAFMSPASYDHAKISDLILQYNKKQDIKDNYMSDNFADTYFSSTACKKIGYIREDIEKRFQGGELNKREKAILITSLLYGMDKIANTCGHYDAYRKTCNFFGELILDIPNLSLKAKYEPTFYHEDANKLLYKHDIKPVDLVYCDPPYNSRNYSDTYHLLENVAAWNKPPVFGVAKKMKRDNIKSKYCSKDAKYAFEELIKNLKCKFIILSYNNTGNKANDRSNARMSDVEISKILKTRGEVIIKSIDYKVFTTGKSKNDFNKERLFICKVKN